tara:strand:- start:10187 stop:10648 length:462 start_codon:yes stop_codon:yes gene_type:complete
MGDFKKDLSFGEKWENMFSLMLVLNGFDKVEGSNGKKEYDILAHKNGKETKFELKADRYPSTGNMAIEIRSRGKASGISVTEADWFVYVYTQLDDKYYYFLFIEPEEIKTIIRNGMGKDVEMVKGGDNGTSEIALIPMAKYKHKFKVKKYKKQ